MASSVGARPSHFVTLGPRHNSGRMWVLRPGLCFLCFALNLGVSVGTCAPEPLGSPCHARPPGCSPWGMGDRLWGAR